MILPKALIVADIRREKSGAAKKETTNFVFLVTIVSLTLSFVSYIIPYYYINNIKH